MKASTRIGYCCGWLWALPMLAQAALQPPTTPRAPRAELIVAGSELSHALALDAHGWPHLVYGNASQSGLPLTHAWYDGQVWLQRQLGADSAHALEMLVHAGVLHVAALLSAPGAGGTGLHYLRVDLASGNSTRREILAGGVARIRLSLSADGARPLITMQRNGGSIEQVDTLQATPSIHPLGIHGRLEDALKRVDAGQVLVAYVVQAPGGNDAVRVAEFGVGGILADLEVGQVNSNASRARLAQAGDGTPLIAYSGQNELILLRSRVASAWACILCESHLRSSEDFDFASAAGSGSALLTRTITAAGGTRLFGVPVRPDGIGEEFDLDPLASAGDGHLGTRVDQHGLNWASAFRSSQGLELTVPREEFRVQDLPMPPITAALASAIDPLGRPVVVGQTAVGFVRGDWSAPAQELVWTVLLPAELRVAAAAAAFGADGWLSLALQPETGGELLLLEHRPGAAPLLSTLDPGPAAHPQLAMTANGKQLIAWLDTASGRVRVLEREPRGAIIAQQQLPGSWPQARPQLAVSRTGAVYLSAYADAPPRIAVHLRDDGWSLVDVIDDPGLLARHALAAAGDGRHALLHAVLLETGVELRLRRHAGAAFESAILHALEAPHAPSVMSLRLLRGSATLPQFLVAQASDASGLAHRVALLRFASAFQGEQVELGELGAAELDAGIGFELAKSAWIHAGGTAGRVLDAPLAAPPVAVWDGGAVVEDLCMCGLSPCASIYLRGVSGASLSTRLRERFATSAAGRHYLELSARHGVELARLALADGAALAQRIRTYQLFAPGLEAFVDGRGDAVIMSAAMLEQARAVWQDYADRGSPALRAAIAAELQATGQLQDFAGGSFEQWFANLPGAPVLHSDGFE